MSIRGIDAHLIVPRTPDFVKDTTAQANRVQFAQQFSVQMTDKETEHKHQIANEVLKDKETDGVDQDGQGSHAEQHESRRGKREKEEPDEFSLTSTMIDIRI